MEHQKGFTLIELMVVITIIGILAAIAFPQFSAYRERAYLSEGLALAHPVMKNVADYYGHRGVFPEDNLAGGVAQADRLKGKYVDSITINKGQVIIRFNNEAGEKSGGSITLVPAVEEMNPSGILRWERRDKFKKG